MCRHMAYLGPDVTLRSLIIDPPYGLYKQAWAPRFQKRGAINADGFGVGWYPGADQAPVRYRQATPIWTDESFYEISAVTRAGAVLGAIRNATPRTSHGAAAAGPFKHGQWLFSHNGAVNGWPGSTAALAATLPAISLLELEARVDSALLWALVLHRLRGGAAPAEALASTAEALCAAGVTGRFNFLLTDGRTIAATTAGHTLYYRQTPGGVTVASEPGDDERGWIDIPRDGSLVTATPGQVTVTRLSALNTIAADAATAHETPEVPDRPECSGTP
ncbi:MAG TPA: ergothioneine biosynthesis protein EgtC [Streptosporangiaceae bacterium]|nr:ergothioneine biosynthesis protein EgtC [Streptosporangiaceae bacterium]